MSKHVRKSAQKKVVTRGGIGRAVRKVQKALILLRTLRREGMWLESAS